MSGGLVCPLCGSDKDEALYFARDRLGLSPGEHRLARCLSCGLVHLNPRPDPADMMKYYPAEYWGAREKGLREFVRGLEARLKESYKLRAVRLAGVNTGRALDIGCGRGEFLDLLRSRGFAVAGLEPGAEAAKRGREEFGLDITHGMLGSGLLPEAGFDLITAWHVIEHLPEPGEALDEVCRALVPGGVFITAVPDFGGAQSEYFREGWFGVDAPRHLFHFTRRTLSGLLEKHGLTPFMRSSCGTRYETAMLVRSLFGGLNRKKLDALEDGRPSRYLYKLAQLVLDFGLLPAGAALVAAGRPSTLVLAARKS